MAKVLAYVFVEVEARKVADVVEACGRIDGVRVSHAVTGRYDVIAQMEAEDFAELANRMLPKLRAIDGVRSTETAIVIPEPREEL